jgi:ABC-type branched-subunit amino acid transport system ATPase component
MRYFFWNTLDDSMILVPRQSGLWFVRDRVSAPAGSRPRLQRMTNAANNTVREHVDSAIKMQIYAKWANRIVHHQQSHKDIEPLSGAKSVISLVKLERAYTSAAHHVHSICDRHCAIHDVVR